MKLNCKEISQIIESLRSRYEWLNDTPIDDDNFTEMIGENSHKFFPPLIKKFEDVGLHCEPELQKR